MDIKQRIEIAKANLRKAEQAKTVAETQKAAAEKQLQDVIAQMAELGVTPETIHEEIEKLQAQLESDLTKVESLMPKVS